MQQVKSRRRVREYGEVFTAEREVRAMCDLIPAEMWETGRKILEPACGNGNFLVEILRRKLYRCRSNAEAEAAVADIYGIDIQEDNIAEARSRMRAIILESFPDAEVDGILQANLIVGDSLKIMEVWSKGEAYGT